MSIFPYYGIDFATQLSDNMWIDEEFVNVDIGLHKLVPKELVSSLKLFPGEFTEKANEIGQESVV